MGEKSIEFEKLTKTDGRNVPRNLTYISESDCGRLLTHVTCKQRVTNCIQRCSFYSVVLFNKYSLRKLDI